MKDIAAYKDLMAKLNAKHGLPSGGSQYLMSVALGPQASAKNQAMMRVAKHTPAKTMPLRGLIRSQ